MDSKTSERETASLSPLLRQLFYTARGPAVQKEACHHGSGQDPISWKICLGIGVQPRRSFEGTFSSVVDKASV